MEDVSVHSNSKPVAQLTVQGGLPPLFLLKVLPHPRSLPFPYLLLTPTSVPGALGFLSVGEIIIPHHIDTFYIYF